MKTCVLIYNGFVQFEVILTCLFMKSKGEIITVALDENEIISIEGFTTKPDKLINEIEPDEIDLFVIPGGNPKPIYNNPELNKVLRKLNEKGKIIAAICAGPVHLAKSGILGGKKFIVDAPELKQYHNDFKNSIYVDESVVVDGNIITAKPNGYVDFVIEIGKVMDIFENDDDLNGKIEFFKYHKNIKNSK